MQRAILLRGVADRTAAATAAAAAAAQRDGDDLDDDARPGRGPGALSAADRRPEASLLVLLYEARLLDARIAAEVARLRQDESFSWRRVGQVVQLTAEGARRRWGR